MRTMNGTMKRFLPLCLDLMIDVRKQCVRETGRTYRARLVLGVVTSVREQGDVVKVISARTND